MNTAKEKNSLFGEFLKYVSLNVAGMIGLSCYILADTIFIARGVGENGLTALNLAIPVYSLIHGMGLMIGMGGATRYAIEKGNKEKSNKVKVNTLFTQALYFALAVSIPFVLAGLFASGLIAQTLGADETVYQMTKTYLTVILLFAPMFLLNNLFICFVRNDNNPKLAMAGMLIGSFSNVVLDYIFVFPWNMGMFGAALATGISPIISLFVLSFHFTRKKNQFTYVKCKLKWTRLTDITQLGISALVTELASGIVIIVFNVILLKLAGNLGVAAYGIVANIALVIISIFTGAAQGMQPIISKNYGEQRFDNIKKIYRYGICFVTIFAILIYSVTFFSVDFIVDLFNKEHNPQLAAFAVEGIHLYFLSFFFSGINIVTTAYLSAITQGKSAFLLSIMRGFLVIIPVAFLMATMFGIKGVWLTAVLTEAIVMMVGASIMFLKKS